MPTTKYPGGWSLAGDRQPVLVLNNKAVMQIKR